MILIQGAMTLEIAYYLECLERRQELVVKSYRFFTGKLAGKEVVISRTKMGTLNAAISTMLGILNFEPKFVLNQGTAGAHLEAIHTGDIIIGEQSEYLNYLVMPPRAEGEGSDSLTWHFKAPLKSRSATSELVEFFNNQPYREGEKYVGIIGSGDIYSREVDRIRWIQSHKHSLCEDMETASVYEVCHKMQVPGIGIRIISNNELLLEPFQEEMAETLQRFIIDSLSRL